MTDRGSFNIEQVEELAARKLGEGATVRSTSEGWVAERYAHGNRTRVTGKTLDVLGWFLTQMPERS